MTTISAAARVFGTAELLETILLQLADTAKGWGDLLLSQRVSQTFKATIGSSPRLQEALHFRLSAETRDDHASKRYNKHVLWKAFQRTCQVDNGGGVVKIIIDNWDYDVHILPLHLTTWDSNVKQRVFAKKLPGPDTDTAATAVETVFGTTELFEEILLGLDTEEWNGLQTLLLSQRMNRMFKATIVHSPQLQEALFFSQTMRKSPKETDECGTLNPLLLMFSGQQLKRRDLGTSEIKVWFFDDVEEDFAARYHSGERGAQICFCMRFKCSTTGPSRELPCPSWQHMAFAQGDALAGFRAIAFDARWESVSSTAESKEIPEASETIGGLMRRLWPRYCR
ncbi:hypothetical protein LTR56_013577 [Elasticomyces elasticus]|nr:hypothetical protein LTR56_013577 [Elasticomyces elasticus]KAK3651041.1 hypothetical protein LTR22_012289 [Elasticomyces elasticus]KAK4931119.1 hypothetical protein LTR49_002535 [Elasticomyces elasticus]KAK5765587.1 hypothetical protein LTS12_004339 [Elasticomyces elasticus]